MPQKLLPEKGGMKQKIHSQAREKKVKTGRLDATKMVISLNEKDIGKKFQKIYLFF